MFLVALSGATTTMRTSIGPIRADPQTSAFLLDVMREVLAVGRAHGIDLPEDYAERRLRLGACPSIRDHRFRREFDSEKAAIKSRTFHCGYRSEHR